MLEGVLFHNENQLSLKPKNPDFYLDEQHIFLRQDYSARLSR